MAEIYNANSNLKAAGVVPPILIVLTSLGLDLLIAKTPLTFPNASLIGVKLNLWYNKFNVK